MKLKKTKKSFNSVFLVPVGQVKTGRYPFI